MSKRIYWAGAFSVIILAIALFKGTSSSEQPVGPVLVPLFESTEATLSFRGLHAAQDTVVVVGGNKGVFGFSLDAGIHWIFQQIPGASESQFRSVWALNDQEFVAVSAGAPTYIYHTENRGQQWMRVFEDTAQSTFLDGIYFLNDREGWIYGDPVDGVFKLLHTVDGGRNWTEEQGPEAIDGEASFAASGSAITYGHGQLSIVTGGTVSRMHTLQDSSTAWKTHYLPLVQGLPSQGAFAHAWSGDLLYVVGGDYMQDTLRGSNVWVWNHQTRAQEAVLSDQLQSLPYCSDVVGDGSRMYFTGTQGVYAFDTVLHELDTTAMHALVYSGAYVFASGPHGRIGRIFTGSNSELDQLLSSLKAQEKH
jgi:photosystem II stability/assembly factor-like uncharacterized protein